MVGGGAGVKSTAAESLQAHYWRVLFWQKQEGTSLLGKVEAKAASNNSETEMKPSSRGQQWDTDLWWSRHPSCQTAGSHQVCWRRAPSALNPFVVFWIITHTHTHTQSTTCFRNNELIWPFVKSHPPPSWNCPITAEKLSGGPAGPAEVWRPRAEAGARGSVRIVWVWWQSSLSRTESVWLARWGEVSGVLILYVFVYCGSDQLKHKRIKY